MSLILKTRQVLVANQSVTVYSVDGKTWISKAHDLLAYRKRYQLERKELRRSFDMIDTSLGIRKISY